MSKHLTLSHLQTILPPIKHLIDKKAEAVDWNENDPSAKGYIRNRPFYEKTEVKELFNDDVYINDSGLYEEYSSSYPGRVNLIEGETYQVIWNDISYSCVAYPDVYGNVCLGNQEGGVILGGYEFPETIVSDEPFFIASWNNNEYYCAIFSGPDTTNHCVIIGNVTEINKIDEKFLPKGIGAAGTGLHAEVFNQNSPEYASGEYSHAEGYQATAFGSFSHAEGWVTLARGAYSHAEGNNTQATENSSHAEGRNTLASGQYAHAEGLDTDATGSMSHAEGSYSVASGAYSHAEGYSTNATGPGTHAEGYATTANGNMSHAEGYHSETQGHSSHAEGYYTIATGDYQHAQGKFNINDTQKKYAHIVGNGTNTARSNAHTLDWSGNAWFAGEVYVGGTNQSEGEKLVKQSELPTIPNSNILNGTSAGSLRSINADEETSSYCMGENAISLGQYSKAFGKDSFSLGIGTQTQYKNCFIAGRYNALEADSSCSVNISHAQKNYSITVNTTCYKITDAPILDQSIRKFSFSALTATQYYYLNVGDFIVETNNLTNTCYYEYLGIGEMLGSGQKSLEFKRYDVVDPYLNQGKYVHIVGNGNSNSSRSNAHTLDWNGNAWYQGDVFVGGTDQDSGERLAKMSDLAASITTDEINTICGVTA